MTFDDLFLDDRLLLELSHLKFETPTAVQEAAIPVILEGKDVRLDDGLPLKYTMTVLYELAGDPREFQILKEKPLRHR